MNIFEIEKVIWGKIESATKKRETEKLKFYNMLAMRIETLKKELVEISELVQHNSDNNINNDHISILKGHKTKNVYGRGALFFPPEGTKCRFHYKHQLYSGNIKNNTLYVDGIGAFESFSAASVDITKTNRNGWRDWYLLLPSSEEWVLAYDWRAQTK